MRLRVLGCHGGESPRHRSTCFLVDDVLAIDAGALTSGLTLPRQHRLKHVLVSHCHLDHVKDLAILADNIAGDLRGTIDIMASAPTVRALRRHIMNGLIWPDFTRIPTPAHPVYRYQIIKMGVETALGQYSVRAVKVSHPVDSTAFLIRDRRGAVLAFSSDTGPTQALWHALRQTSGLRAVLLEVSFPNQLQALADRVGHLTPRTLRAEIRKLEQDVPILLYHMKPAYADRLARELRRIPDRRLRVLSLGETFRF